MTTYEELQAQRENDLWTIWEHFKATNQCAKLYEELKEFMDALDAYYLDAPTADNWDHLIEEWADLNVVLDQFALVLEDDAQHDGRLYHTLLEKKKAEKIARTLERIKDGYYDRER